ncbi:MAG: DUF4173 domain-containing protein [Anaerolineales bacterium]|nr:DUF4173 domain-containing protein [Anaerolineales bacterium]
MQPKNFPFLAVLSLLLAWVFDQLFWQKPIGISFPLFVLLCLGVGLWLTWREGRRIPADIPLASLVLIPLTLFFAVMAFVRQEPLTQFLSFSLALGGLLLTSLTWLGGGWWRYQLRDYLVNFFRWFGSLFDGAGKALKEYRPSRPREDAEGEQTNEGARRASGLKPLWAVLRGLLLALPVLLILASLLAAADPIFDQMLRQAFKIFSLDKLGEYIFRTVYILVGAYALAGVYLYALRRSEAEKITGDDQPWPAPFLGWVEAATLLVCVDLLFAAFVSVQFRYFFGGQANINLEGYTYATYARRGFGELVMVAFLSLLIFLGLNVITRRTDSRQRNIFSGLGIGLVALVGVILVSAFQRLLMYEAVYGFTRLRTYTHVFMVWLGLLLLAAVTLEVLRRQRYFALALLIFCLGFVLSLGLLNVDALITRQNLNRSQQEQPLDLGYLVSSLSDDAVPTLFDQFHAPATPDETRHAVGGVLACRAALKAQDTRANPWPGYHWSRASAENLFRTYEAELLAYQTYRDEYNRWYVRVDGVEHPCFVDYYID